LICHKKPSSFKFFFPPISKINWKKFNCTIGKLKDTSNAFSLVHYLYCTWTLLWNFSIEILTFECLAFVRDLLLTYLVTERFKILG
jgi:hypothetical protein